MALIKPPVLPPWADSGDKVQPSNAELQVGWPLSSTPPARQRFNWILNYLANAVRYFSRRGIPDYDAAETYMTGDRIIGDDGQTYRSVQDNNTAHTPSTSSTWWELWGPSALKLQQAAYMSAVAGGTVDAITAAFTPAIAALPAAPGTLSVFVRATGANTSTTPTFKADGTAAKTIVKGNNVPLLAGDIAGAGHWLELQYDPTLDKWVLQNPARGVTTKGIQRFTANGSFTVPAGVTTIYVSGCGGGGGGGGGAGSSGQTSSVGGGGGGGGGAGQSVIRQAYTVTPGQVISITIGGSGTAGAGSSSSNTGGTSGGAGGNTVVGALVTLTGGGGGVLGGWATGNSFGGGGAGAAGGTGYPSGSSGSDSNYAGNGGGGAASPFGGGGGSGRAATGTGISGSAGVGYGSGGGGGGGAYGLVGNAGGTGGAGAPGLVIIEW